MPDRILVVDDEEDELTGWETALRRRGYFVRTASTAKKALELCDQFRFDLVLLDYLMPRMKGLELLARIRKKLPLIRSIVVSGKLDKKLLEQEVRETVRGEVETDRYLHKPVDNERLLGVIAEILESRPSANSWAQVAEEHIRAEKGTVSKAKGAQKKLKKHLTKG